MGINSMGGKWAKICPHLEMHILCTPAANPPEPLPHALEHTANRTDPRSFTTANLFHRRPEA